MRAVFNVAGDALRQFPFGFGDRSDKTRSASPVVTSPCQPLLGVPSTPGVIFRDRRLKLTLNFHFMLDIVWASFCLSVCFSFCCHNFVSERLGGRVRLKTVGGGERNQFYL